MNNKVIFLGSLLLVTAEFGAQGTSTPPTAMPKPVATAKPNTKTKPGSSQVLRATAITSDKNNQITATPTRSDQSPNVYVLDAIEAIIYEENGMCLVTKSDISRPNLAGGVRTLDDTIFENLLYLDAKKHKVLPDSDAVDRYLANIMQQNSLTADDMNRIFSQAGYTLEEGRDQLAFMQAINTMLEFKIRSNLIVPKKDIEQYYHAHPEYTKERYSIAYATIPYTSGDKDKQLKAVNKKIQAGTLKNVDWSEPIWINAQDLAADKKFITALAVGAISQPVHSDEGLLLYKLVEKQSARLLTLDERRQDIIDTLRQPLYAELLDEYRKTLFDRSSVVYFNQAPAAA